MSRTAEFLIRYSAMVLGASLIGWAVMFRGQPFEVGLALGLAIFAAAQSVENAIDIRQNKKASDSTT